MAVKIRLSRIGKKHVPFYRIVAIDSRKQRDGQVLDNLGTYDGLKASLVVFNEEKYAQWISKGAQPTDSAKKVYKIYKKSGVSKAPGAPAAVEEKPKAKAKAKKAEKSTPNA